MLAVETVDMSGPLPWVALAIGAFAIGIAKTGLPGVGILVVPLLAMVFPAKASVGLLLPILIFADLIAVAYYRRHGHWRHLVRLLPCALAGIVAGFLILDRIDNATLKPLIGIIVLAMLLVRFRTILRPDDPSVPHHGLFAGTMGFLSGASSMMANAAGPVMTLYLLSMRFDKKKFIGTAAWFFFIVNWVKFPFMVHLDMITMTSIKMNLMVLPAVALGAWAGIWLLHRIPQRLFNILALLLAAAAAVKLLF